MGQQVYSPPSNLFPCESPTTLVFTPVQRPFFPRYSVRIKMSDLCDPTVKPDIYYSTLLAPREQEHPSERRRDILNQWRTWMFVCNWIVFRARTIVSCSNDTGPKFHPESWNTNANIFFVD
ncbi:hypothetical protein K435DRAFT_487105 [Dendrothele bispora CBS 962.96]|uniref:Uncharacterized protein n=1 Tax=Dendrothele bispora (strain CBS 962.96) TaxID=1314807 RepID=A0A4S8KYC7_DENBC|nr:hypothetical protein K435DRAFT_487105 [Dendrothele bispora CBS 962.96]